MEGLMTNTKYIEENRTVHAVWNGTEAVRYLDEWFLEPVKIKPRRSLVGYIPPGSVEEITQEVDRERKKVSLEEAAKAAAKGVREAWEPSRVSWPAGFQIFWGQEDGEQFDEIVKSIHPELHVEIQWVDLDNSGHTVMLMTCPGCREWFHIYDGQLEGSTCTNHSRDHNGCGFHGYVIGANAGYVIDWGDKHKKAA